MLMRKYACCYAQGRRGAREFRSRVVKVSTPAEFYGVVESYFPRECCVGGRGVRRFRRLIVPAQFERQGVERQIDVAQKVDERGDQQASGRE